MKKVLILALILYDVVESNRRETIGYQMNRDIDEVSRQKASFLDDERMSRKKPQMDLYEARRPWEERKESSERRANNMGGYKRKHRPSSFEDMDNPSIPNRSGDYGVDETKKPLDPPSVEKEGGKSFHWDCDREHERYESCFAGCAAVSCDNPRDRLRPCYPFCEPGCICIPPLVRDDRTHKCVMPEECTKGLKGIPDLNQVDEIAI